MQVVVFGGEQQEEQDENTGGNEAGAESDDSKAVAMSELCLLEPDHKLWVPMTITGGWMFVRARVCAHVCVCCSRFQSCHRC